MTELLQGGGSSAPCDCIGFLSSRLPSFLSPAVSTVPGSTDTCVTASRAPQLPADFLWSGMRCNDGFPVAFEQLELQAVTHLQLEMFNLMLLIVAVSWY